jgi:hypothetical protein
MWRPRSREVVRFDTSKIAMMMLKWRDFRVGKWVSM